MNENQIIQESIVSDIVDALTYGKEIKDFVVGDGKMKNGRVGSIAKRTSNLVLVFPVLASSSLSGDTAILITKAIERKCVALVQMLFAATNITSANNLFDYVDQVHSNLGKKMDIDSFIGFLDSISDGKIQIINKEQYNAIRESMKGMYFYLDDTFNECSLNDYTAKFNPYTGKTSIVLTEDIVHNHITKTTNPASDSSDFFRHQLLPMDVAKANEAMPTLLTVQMNYNDPNSDKPIFKSSGIIGVKCKLYAVDQMEIINRLSSKYNDSNSFFKLIKASTGEISFFKDFVLAANKAKFDAIEVAKNNGSARIFKMLEKRAAKDRVAKLLKKNDASPITSLVVSQEEVDYLRKYNNIDLERQNVIKAILNGYNLMDIWIVDESLEITKCIYDDDYTAFESYTFRSLEKDNKDDSYKKIVNLLAKSK